jgi:hypothetical protein
MAERAPPIDPRTADEVAADVKNLLTVYMREWKVEQDRLGTALISIFARFAELIIERLNQAPGKNFLAFLDLLGAARLPPQPARVPLTFNLAASSPVDAVVPAGTQIAAPPLEGERRWVQHRPRVKSNRSCSRPSVISWSPRHGSNRCSCVIP